MGGNSIKKNWVLLNPALKETLNIQRNPWISGPVHATPKKFENAAIAAHFGFVFEEDHGKEITWIS